MSHCLIVKSDNDLFIGSDTALSTQINGEHFRLKEQTDKLFQFDELLLFCSGKLSIVNEIINRLKELEGVSLESVRVISRLVYEEMNGEEDVDIVVAINDSNPKVYSIAPYNNFNIKELEGSKDGISVWSAGIKTQQGIDMCENEILSGNNHIINIYRSVFNQLSSEVIGGNLHLYHLDGDKISLIYNSIVSEKDMKRVNMPIYATAHLVVADVLIGKVILAKEKLVVGDEEGTFEIEGNLLTIRDRNEITRLRLGEYTSNQFGLQLMNKTGSQVVLDENGILQTWQEGRSDNVDTSHGLTMYVYLPADTLSIRQANLNFRLLPFRSYSGTTKSGGGGVQTSASGGGTSTSTSSGGSSTPTSSSGGGTSTSTQSGGSSAPTSQAGGDHTHVMFSIVGFGGEASPTEYTATAGAVNESGTALRLPGNNAAGTYRTQGSSGTHSHSVSVPAHTHNFSTPNHSHTVNVPAHTHNVTISNHTHSVTIPPHDHEILHGIYTDTFATGVGIIINNINRTSALGGKFNASQANIDIKDYLNVGQWNEITLTSDRLGRIDSSIFLQAFMST